DSSSDRVKSSGFCISKVPMSIEHSFSTNYLFSHVSRRIYWETGQNLLYPRPELLGLATVDFKAISLNLGLPKNIIKPAGDQV
ncbi:hypothetical protein MK292_09010, partial [Myxococcota bacterium]|nr:hypothetical protein [Myxococcota bacterium]